VVTRLVLDYVNPPLRIIEIPAGAGRPLVEALSTAFALFWGDPSASGNRIRSSVEFLLDQEKVPRRRKAGGDLTLHARLIKYRAKRPDVADKLMAIKWLGNAGTHTRTLSHNADQIAAKGSKTQGCG
jgi:hypothetical protein